MYKPHCMCGLCVMTDKSTTHAIPSPYILYPNPRIVHSAVVTVPEVVDASVIVC